MDMSVDMDDPSELAALEERLYSNLHHAYEAPSNSEGTQLAVVKPAPTRMVSQTSVVNNVPSATKNTQMRRYWAGGEGFLRGPKPYQQKNPNSYQKRLPSPESTLPDSNGARGAAGDPVKMMFKPYQSLLGNYQQNCSVHQASVRAEKNVTKVPDRISVLTSGRKVHKTTSNKKLQKKLSKKNQHTMEIKLAGLMKLIDRDSHQTRKQRLESKKTKAFLSRQRNNQRIVAQINLDSSDEESSTHAVVKQDELVNGIPTDDETDEVVIIPTPDPPKICIDSSDDEVAQDSFAFPHAKKRTKTAMAIKSNSPRCLSPSSSSIMSDDFIGHNDRSRLNDSFVENIPNDDELACAIEGQRHTGLPPGGKDAVPSRQQRAPSISSEGTVCTSSDTTEQEKLEQDLNIGIDIAVANVQKEAPSSSKTSSNARGSKEVQSSFNPSVPSPSSITATSSSTKQTGGNSNGTVVVRKSVGSKPRTRCKSPISIAMELARKHFEVPRFSENTAGNSKSKKDQTVQVNKTRDGSDSSLSSIEHNTVTTAKKAQKTRSSIHSDADSMYQIVDELKSKSDPLPLCSDSVSSESDYDITLVTSNVGARNQESEASVDRDISSKQLPDTILPALDRLTSISSESDYETSFTRAQKSTPKKAKDAKKRSTRKRKQYNSENYSDEDFACMLTDIVQAVSDSDDDEEVEMEEQAKAVSDAVVTSTTTVEHDSGKLEPQSKTASPPANTKKRHEDSSLPLATVHLESDTVGGIVQSAEKATLAGNREDVTPQSSIQNPPVNTTLPDCAWNKEMQMFYNDVWMDKDFSLSSVIKKMPSSKKHWQIVQQDRYPEPPRRELICNNCGEAGHMRYKCRNAPKPRVCYMCGEQGHQEPRCPNTICLNCGAKTRNFIRGCHACGRNLQLDCRLCGVRGHVYRNCPDMWRRYHSTTEDNVPLKQQYQVNLNALQCCICGKPGHQPHRCNAAYRIFGQAVPTVHVQSYQQSYPAYRSSDETPSAQTPRYNLLSEDANECELNLHELADNANGFYYRFAKSSGLLRQQEDRLHSEREASEHYTSVRNSDETVRSAPSAVQQYDAAEGSKKKRNYDHDPALITENSNYNFSEYFTEADSAVPKRDEMGSKEQNIAKQCSSLDGFISLTTETLAPPHPSLEDAVCKSNAKIFLSKPDALRLLAYRGAKFLRKAALTQQVTLSITFESVGYVLQVCGRPDEQDNFHEQVVEFLKTTQITSPEIEEKCVKCSQRLPKNRDRMVCFLAENFLQLKQAHRDAHLLFRDYQLAVTNGESLGERERRRRLLNIVLFGQYGLREGRKHLYALREQLIKLLNSTSPAKEVEHSMRSEIHESQSYIFSAFDHDDYSQIIRELNAMLKTRRVRRIQSISDMDLPKYPRVAPISRGKGRNQSSYFGDMDEQDDPENTSSELMVGKRAAENEHHTMADTAIAPTQESYNSPQTRRQKRDRNKGRNWDRNQPDDLILNTSDQMIDSDRLRCLDRATRELEDEPNMKRMSFAGDECRPEQGTAFKRTDNNNGRYQPKKAPQTYSDRLLTECQKLSVNADEKTKQQAMDRLTVVRHQSEQNSSRQIREFISIRNMLRENQRR